MPFCTRWVRKTRSSVCARIAVNIRLRRLNANSYGRITDARPARHPAPAARKIPVPNRFKFRFELPKWPSALELPLGYLIDFLRS
jgi:hypothetical protein